MKEADEYCAVHLADVEFLLGCDVCSALAGSELYTSKSIQMVNRLFHYIYIPVVFGVNQVLFLY